LQAAKIFPRTTFVLSRFRTFAFSRFFPVFAFHPNQRRVCLDRANLRFYLWLLPAFLIFVSFRVFRG
jgi:hypothetical protein